jgi:hypothetical protein
MAAAFASADTVRFGAGFLPWSMVRLSSISLTFLSFFSIYGFTLAWGSDIHQLEMHTKRTF